MQTLDYVAFRKWLIALSLCMLFVSGKAHAHADGENYVWLTMEEDRIAGWFELNKKDLISKMSIELDLANPTQNTDQDIAHIQEYLQNSFQILDGTVPLKIVFTDTKPFEEKVEIIQFYFETASNPGSSVLQIRNTIFLDKEKIQKDRLHKSLVLLEYNKKVDKYFGAENVVQVFDSRQQVQSLDFENPAVVYTWPDFFRQGVLHILFGFDHVLFVITILLTCAISYRRSEGWQERQNLKSTLWTIFKLLTVFTIAHSITLTISALGLIEVNIAFVELVIVLSIMVMAINNIKPLFSHESMLIVFLFGLFHGVGFASVMHQLAFRNVFIERIVVLFNLGIELGQLMVALVVAPIVYFLSRTAAYRNWGMQLASCLIVVIAGYWLIERVGAF